MADFSEHVTRLKQLRKHTQIKLFPNFQYVWLPGKRRRLCNGYFPMIETLSVKHKPRRGTLKPPGEAFLMYSLIFCSHFLPLWSQGCPLLQRPVHGQKHISTPWTSSAHGPASLHTGLISGLPNYPDLRDAQTVRPPGRRTSHPPPPPLASFNVFLLLPDVKAPVILGLLFPLSGELRTIWVLGHVGSE